MGGGDLNAKKSWHPNTLKNQERVWKAEQAALEEKRRITELQQERAQERDHAELTALAKIRAGSSVAADDRLQWMYDKPERKVQTEDYLLGKAIDASFDRTSQQDQNSIAVLTRRTGPVEATVTNSDAQVDVARKLREDPLVLVKERERAARAALLNNPLQRRRLAQLLRLDQEKRKEKKEKTKAKKKSKELDDILTAKLSALGGENGVNLAVLLANDSDSSSDASHKRKHKKKKPKKDDKSEKKLHKKSKKSKLKRKSSHSKKSKQDSELDESSHKCHKKDRVDTEKYIESTYKYYATLVKKQECKKKSEDDNRDKDKLNKQIKEYNKFQLQQSDSDDDHSEPDKKRKKHEYQHSKSKSVTNKTSISQEKSTSINKHKSSKSSRKFSLSDEEPHTSEIRRKTAQRNRSMSPKEKPSHTMYLSSKSSKKYASSSDGEPHNSSEVRRKKPAKRNRAVSPKEQQPRTIYPSSKSRNKYASSSDDEQPHSSEMRKRTVKKNRSMSPKERPSDQVYRKKTSGLSEAEKAAKLAEMMRAGVEHETRRGERVAAQRAALDAEEKRPINRAGHSEARALPKSLESRLQSNRHYIQRDKRHMNEHFARR